MKYVYDEPLPEIDDKIVLFKTEKSEKTFIGQVSASGDGNVVSYSMFFGTYKDKEAGRCSIQNHLEIEKWKEYNSEDYKWFDTAEHEPDLKRRLLISLSGNVNCQFDLHVAYKSYDFNDQFSRGQFYIDHPYKIPFGIGRHIGYEMLLPSITATVCAKKWCYFDE